MCACKGCFCIDLCCQHPKLLYYLADGRMELVTFDIVLSIYVAFTYSTSAPSSVSTCLWKEAFECIIAHCRPSLSSSSFVFVVIGYSCTALPLLKLFSLDDAKMVNLPRSVFLWISNKATTINKPHPAKSVFHFFMFLTVAHWLYKSTCQYIRLEQHPSLNTIKLFLQCTA